MKIVMLCGGLGTRLREETEYRPKPMVEIGGRPILWHIMKLYAHNGFKDFVFCLGYRGNMIKEYFLNYEAMNNDFSLCLGRNSRIEYKNVHREQDFQVTLVDTGQTTMTGGRPEKSMVATVRADGKTGGRRFFVTHRSPAGSTLYARPRPT